MTVQLMHQRFPNEIESIQRARLAAVEASRPRLAVDEVEVVRLLTSELVTNCVQHGHGTIAVTVTVDDGSLSVSVRDSGEGAVHIPGKTADPGGHGLRLVDAMSAGWEQVTEAPTEVRFWVDLAP